jgi:hypothetical protein
MASAAISVGKEAEPKRGEHMGLAARFGGKEWRMLGFNRGFDLGVVKKEEEKV